MDTTQPTNTLFIAEVPSSINEKDFVKIFQAQEGFKNARLRKDRNQNVVGFADFEDVESSSLALETLQGYKFGLLGTAEKGLNIHYSHNATNSHSNSFNVRGPRHDRPHSQASIGSGRERESNNTQHQENGSTRPQHPSLSFMPDLSPLSLQTSHPSHTPQTSNSVPNYSVPNVFPQLPSDASSTLFIEGLPSDATEREVAHIFRPFPGYQSLRILNKESKQSPNRLYTLCFVEFDNKYQATFAMNHLQGYRFEKDDAKGLSMSYAKTERKTKPSTRGDGRPKINTQRNE
jgi:RNA recognition motif-containing protein